MMLRTFFLPAKSAKDFFSRAGVINEWHLLARAVLVLDADNKVTYVEYLDNINSEPNYEAAIEAVKALG